MSDRSFELYGDESSGSKLARKAKESPFLIAGILGCTAACAIGAYKFKHRGEMSTSVFLMQLRVAAQGIAVGSLTVGMVVSMFNQHVLHKKPE